MNNFNILTFLNNIWINIIALYYYDSNINTKQHCWSMFDGSITTLLINDTQEFMRTNLYAQIDAFVNATDYPMQWSITNNLLIICLNFNQIID